MKKINGEHAKKMLSECRPEYSFWINNGPIVKSLNELSSGLKGITDVQFTHHLNKEKNDFSKWVNDVIGDAELAEDLKKVKTKTAAIKKINERLEMLKKTAC
ncbi:hypothetical protein HYU11_04765 [Candidatus Woesearchaeota archaeon]|nr:hypothetical protein [Candidatus Woesearchaeota archaeon]